MREIIFTSTLHAPIEPEYFPKPSKKVLPDWYKNQKSYVSDKPKEIIYGEISATIKKCMPVFDILTSGYIIPTYQEIAVEQREEGVIFSTITKETEIGWHSTKQAESHPYNSNVIGFPKFISPWSIKTPKGYSCLFINPVHGANEYVTILEGIVDTDEYLSPVNFPFVLKNPKFEGIIPVGTPLVQVIPFKREKWHMQLGKEKEKKDIAKNHTKLKTVFYEGYKKFFWSSKSFD